MVSFAVFGQPDFVKTLVSDFPVLLLSISSPSGAGGVADFDMFTILSGT